MALNALAAVPMAAESEAAPVVGSVEATPDVAQHQKVTLSW